MQDQMRFEDENGEWIKFNEKFPSNHFGTYKKCGEWAKPVFPNNISLIGSPQTPYIWDTKLDFRDLAKTITEVYNLESEQRQKFGLSGREWVMSEESMMSSNNMCKNIISGVDKVLTKFQPRKSFELVKSVNRSEKKILHPLTY